MKKLFKKYSILLGIVFGSFFLFSGTAHASGNIYGYAWSDSAGWISVNCDQTPVGGPNTCSTVDYGVTLNETTGALTGDAWSDTLGWVKFFPTISTPTYAANPGVGGATVSGITIDGIRPIVGWIRFCANVVGVTLPDTCGNTSGSTTAAGGGWNGWVSMIGNGRDGKPPYGVTYDTTTGDFDGFAWGGTLNSSGTEVVGWINFKGVLFIKTPPVQQIPVVSLIATTPIQTGGTTDIKYHLDAPGLNPLVACTPYIISGTGVYGVSNVANWNNTTYTTHPLPTSTAGLVTSVYAYSPSTTYILLCKTSTGEFAADPTNPTTQCNIATAATAVATCPRTKVAVITPSKNLILRVKETSQPLTSYGPGPITIDPVQTASLQWSTGGPGNMTNCIGYSDTNVWTGAKASLISPVFIQREPTVGVIAPATIYQIECLDVTTSQRVWSNPVEVKVKSTISNPVLLQGTLTGAGAWASTLTVNQGQKIDLKWSSASQWDTCTASAVPSVASWNGTVNGLFGPTYTNILQNISVPGAPGDSVTYTVDCTNSLGNMSNSSVIVTINNTIPVAQIQLEIARQTVPATYDTVGVIVNPNETVNLRWTLTGGSIVPNRCVVVSVPNVVSGAVPDPIPLGSGIKNNVLVSQASPSTSYRVDCVDALYPATLRSSNIVTATILTPVGPSAAISGPTCVKNENILFDLYWTTANIAGGSCTLSNTAGLTLWDGLVSVATDSINHRVSGLSIPLASGSVDFSLSCVDSSGVSAPTVTHTVTIDPNCTQSPRKNWFFRFFEK